MDTFNHDQPQAYPERLEAGTLNAHGIAGLSAALDFIHDTGMQAIRMKEQALADRFYQGIKDLPQVTCYGDFSRERAPIVSLNIGTTDSGTISAELADAFGIATRPGGHCAPRLHEALGTKRQGAVRFSFSWFNTADETDAAIEAIRYLATE
jgi:selenocysteine lyase/cysteine desulfurase